MAWIKPDWPAPSNVKAISTTRAGGASEAPFDSLNLGTHVGDKLDVVLANRTRLQQQAGLPASPVWLNQIHSTRVVELPLPETAPLDADAAFTSRTNQVCCAMTADCLPVLFCNKEGTKVAVAHAGWRGLLDGVLENTVEKFGTTDGIIAWLGPAIGPAEFEVGNEVREMFVAKDPDAASGFRVSGERWLADIYLLARQRLASLNITDIYGGNRCTVTEHDQFFSYRRDGQTGRQASLIWLEG